MKRGKFFLFLLPALLLFAFPHGVLAETVEVEGEKGLILGIFSPGQAVIGELILLALIGSGIAFVAYSRRKPTQEPKEPTKGGSAPGGKKEEEPKEEEFS